LSELLGVVPVREPKAISPPNEPEAISPPNT
jgi:hypothetical protein